MAEKNNQGKKQETEKNMMTDKRKKQLPLVLGAAALACVALAAAIFGPKQGNKAADGTDQVVSAGESFKIPISSVSETASFYPLKVDDTDMEIIAIKDQQGNIRTAFNTCQSCYTSGNGYYEAEGNELVCHNCGFHFTAEQVEVEGGGCNPYPIFEENKEIVDGNIEISYDFLKESTGIFATWGK